MVRGRPDGHLPLDSQDDMKSGEGTEREWRREGCPGCAPAKCVVAFCGHCEESRSNTMAGSLD